MTIIFACFALLSLSVLAGLGWTARKRGPRRTDRRRYAIETFEAQATEIDQAVETGSLSIAEAEAAKSELIARLRRADRQLPKSYDANKTASDGGVRSRVVIAAVAILAAVGLYTLGGNPALPTAKSPLARPKVNAEQQRALAETHAQNVENPMVRGAIAAQVGDYAAAIKAYEAAESADPDFTDAIAARGFAYLSLAEGRVTPAARLVFLKLGEREPTHPGYLFFQGLDLAQRGDKERAYLVWSQLAANSPPQAPWMADLSQRLTALAADLGIEPGAVPGVARRGTPPSSSAPPELTPEMVDSVAALPPEEQDVFIRQMVERFAARLKDSPEDGEGWLRLARIYVELGETENAAAALETARATLGETDAVTSLAAEIGALAGASDPPSN